MNDKYTIPAECHSDDFVVQVEFDAATWFEKATDDEIIELINCGFRGDYPSDEVAIWMADSNEDIAFMFKYLETIQDDPMKKDYSGFECSVNPEKAVKWIENNRPELASVLENAKSEEYF